MLSHLRQAKREPAGLLLIALIGAISLALLGSERAVARTHLDSSFGRHGIPRGPARAPYLPGVAVAKEGSGQRRGGPRRTP